MRANALLVVDRFGCFWVEDDAAITEMGVRVEKSIGVGHTQSRAESRRQALGELARFAEGQTEITVGIDPTGDGDVPFRDFDLMSTVECDGADREVVTITFARDPDRPRHVDYVPQLGDTIDSHERRLARTNQKMSNGTGGGSFRIASPLSSIPKADPPNCCPPQLSDPE